MTTSPLEEAAARAERRQFGRRKFRGSMEIEWGSTILKGTIRDIGPRGLFVELTPPLWLGATFHARVILNPTLLLDCTVVRVEPGMGVAVVFDVPEENGKTQMEGLLVSLPAV